MLRQTLRYGTGLIALYVVVAHGSAFGQVISAGAEGTSKITRTLQGR
jgi:hypothetical protein